MNNFKNNCVGQNPLFDLASQISTFQNPIELASQLQKLSEESDPQTYQMKDLFNEILNVEMEIKSKNYKWKNNAVDEWLVEYSQIQNNSLFLDPLENNYICDPKHDDNNKFCEESNFFNFEEMALQNISLRELPDDFKFSGKNFVINITDPLFENSQFFGYLNEISKDIDLNINNDKLKFEKSNPKELIVSNKSFDEFCLKHKCNDINQNTSYSQFNLKHNLKDLPSENIFKNNGFLKDEFAQPFNKFPRMSNEIENNINVDGVFVGCNTDVIAKEAEAVKDKFWNDLSTHWNEVANKNSSQKCDWLSNPEEINSYNYIFVSGNEYSFEDLLEKGISYFNDGNFIEAVLHLESYLKNESNSSEAWLLLGEAQATLENDVQAIAALNRCLIIDPKNLYCHLLLAVSYMNESKYSKSCQMLYDYLSISPKYSFVLIESNPFATNSFFSLVNRSLLQILIDAFLKAVNCETNADANLQIGLGILFKIAGDLDKSADCFRTVVQINDKDWSSWNKLGAVLSHLNRDEEAIGCYTNVLELAYGSLRARHNIALSCVKLHFLKEAMQHFLSVITTQEQLYFDKTKIVHQHNQSVWNFMKSTLIILNRPDLIAKCDSRDLDFLNTEFLTI